MPQLAIRLFGTPEITLDDQPVSFDTRKAIALLAYLVVVRQPVRRATLATLLWPESDGKRARSALRRTLATLNSGIGKRWLEVSRETIAFITSEHTDCLVDIYQFADLIKQARRDCMPRTKEQANCLSHLTQAVSLYRGDFLEGFSLKDSVMFDDWHATMTEQLRQAFAELLAQLTQVYRTQRDWPSAIRQAQRWLLLDLLAEEAHRMLMSLYSLAGQRSDALRQYERCVQLLDEELGVEPQPETRALFEQIVAGEGTQEVAATTTPLHYTLTEGLSPFIGRERELSDLTALLRNPQCRLMTLIGIGGIGKTRLARAVGRQLEGDFTNGVCFVSLETVESAESLLPAIATALDYAVSGSVSLFDQLTQFLHNKSLLLITDNLEQLLDATFVLTDLLCAAPQVKILATSQERLNLSSEWVYAVEGLRRGDAAQQLFVTRALQVRPHFTIDDPDAVAEICRLVDGIPLGIELAASWVQLFPPTEIAQRIARNSQFLVTTLRDVPERHRSLHAIFEYSWSLLCSSLRATMSRLSVFRGGCSEEAARNVAGVDLLTLRQLVNRSLLTQETPGRFAMPAVLRRFVVTQGVDDQSLMRHAVYYQQFLHDGVAGLKGAKQKMALAALKVEIENIRAAWRWLVDTSSADIDSTATALFLLYERLGWFEEGIAVFSDKQFNAQRGALLVGQANYVEGKQFLQQIAQHDTQPIDAFVSYYLGIADEAAGEYDSAENLQTTVLARYRTQVDKWGMSNALTALGNIARLRQQIDPALQHYRDSLRISEEIGDLRGIARSHHNLAHMHEAVGRFDEAYALYQKSIDLKRELGDHRGLAFSLNNLGFLLYQMSNLEAAHPALENAHMLFVELGYQRGEGYTLINLGHVARARQQERHAQTLYQSALTILEEVGDVRGATLARTALKSAR